LCRKFRPRAPPVTLTAKGVRALPAGEDGGRAGYWDQEVRGLVLRVTAEARANSVWYRVNGVPRRLTLGPIDEVSLADARDRAQEIRRQARSGIDAVIAKRAAAAEAQKARLAGETFGDLAARYLEAARVGEGMKRGEALAPRTLDEYRRILKADVLPAIAAIAPAEVTKAQIRSLVDSIRSEGHPVHANRVLAVLKSIFSWAVRKDLIANSPCSGLQATREHPRERVYSDAELRAVGAAMAGTELEHLVPLILFTATRSEEARSARWADIDLELAGKLGRERDLLRASAALRDRRRKKARQFFSGVHGPRALAAMCRNTPREARRWGFLMNMGLDSFRSTFDKHVQSR
jgi:integrase